MEFTTLPFEYEVRYGDQFKDWGIPLEQAAMLEDRDRQLEDYLAGVQSEVSWSTGTTVAVVVGDRKSFLRPVTVLEFRMDLKGTITGTYTARLLKNGSAVSGSSVSLTAAGCDYVELAEAVGARPDDYIEAEITAVGSGATGMTLTVVYA